MNKLLITLLMLFSGLVPGTAQQYGWHVVNPVGITGTPGLSDLSFIGPGTGWISSSTANSVFYTLDGAAFTPQAIETTIMAIHMLDGNNGYAASDDGSIYRTTSGGTNWNFLASTFATLNDITFPRTGSTATGYACGDNGAIFSVTSSGATAMTSGVVSNLQSITFPTATEGWVCGQSVILHFASGAWHGDQAYPSGTYNAIYFVDNKKGWAIGTKIIHTIDGQTWTAQTNPDTLGRTLVGIFFLNENEGWIVGNQGLILHTINGGTNWAVEANGLTSALLRGVQFTSSTNGYVVGNNKTLLKYAQLTSMVDAPASDQVMVFPNPTDGLLQLSGLPNENWQLSLVDITGREVFRQEAQALGGIIRYDISHLKPGVYVINLKNNEKSITKKIIKH